MGESLGIICQGLTSAYLHCASMCAALHSLIAHDYDDIVGQSQNIKLKENVTYGPAQQ